MKELSTFFSLNKIKMSGKEIPQGKSRWPQLNSIKLCSLAILQCPNIQESQATASNTRLILQGAHPELGTTPMVTFGAVTTGFT